VKANLQTIYRLNPSSGKSPRRRCGLIPICSWVRFDIYDQIFVRERIELFDKYQFWEKVAAFSDLASQDSVPLLLSTFG